jgi:hypothetical protein
MMTDHSCAWCDGPVPPSRGNRPRLYCSPGHRQLRARYLERLPGWQAELAEYEAAAAGWTAGRRAIPTHLRNEIARMHDLIARGRPGDPR